MNNKLKVVWICHLSNDKLRKSLSFDKTSLLALLRRIFNRYKFIDFAQWNTNAIIEFEKYNDIELHVISPHSKILHKTQDFIINGVNYHIFRSETESLFWLVFNRIFNKTTFRKNSKIINDIINNVKPDIIHLIGAENPYYGEAILHIDNHVPLIVSLQTLLKDPIVLNNYPQFKNKQAYRVVTESKIIEKVDYIGTKIEHFRNIIKKEINSNAKFLDISLAVGEDITISDYKKEYDFVYFAANISKAVDWALEAFVIAKQKYPNITLHVVGGYNSDFMSNIKNRMKELGLGNEVDFSGLMPTHDDVIDEVRKARFALLPIKSDLITGTIREAMSNGLPVVTTITPATPELNAMRESILLSEKGDFKAMADNMCKLLFDAGYAKQLQQNAAQTVYERYSNETAMKEWREVYYEILRK